MSLGIKKQKAKQTFWELNAASNVRDNLNASRKLRLIYLEVSKHQ